MRGYFLAEQVSLQVMSNAWDGEPRHGCALCDLGWLSVVN